MNYVFLGAFAAFSAVHLYASWRCDKVLRAVTKVFLLPTLLGWYLTTVQTPLDIVIAAVATSWLGDVLLIFGTVGLLSEDSAFSYRTCVSRRPTACTLIFRSCPCG